MFKYVLLFTLFTITQMNAQSLEKYRWENRLVVLLSNAPDNPVLQKQLDIFNADPAGLRERKLKIIQITPAQIRKGIHKNKPWENSPGELYKQYHRTDQPFEAVLIGLDGGEKLRDQQPFTLDRLFAVIDAMPMRRSEIRRQ